MLAKGLNLDKVLEASIINSDLDSGSGLSDSKRTERWPSG